ncbi:MAG: hypothetical protein COB65_01335 [Thalassobium sp.]|nr:MAG: hypothetical protein COB65_01335 [Thalassobium sp.]
MKKSIIFDLDGCLVESEVLALRAIANSARELGAQDISEQEMCGQLLGLKMSKIGDWVEQKAGSPVPEDFADRIDAELMAQYPTELNPVNGAITVLSFLELQGFQIALATGSSTTRMQLALKTTGLSRFFEGRACSSDQVENGKPAPDLFLHAANLLDRTAGNCLVLEDSPNGVRGAVAAGMSAIGFVGGSHLKSIREEQASKLLDAGCELVIHDLTDVIDLAGDHSTLFHENSLRSC